jgi:CheY-like chemotaxis protein
MNKPLCIFVVDDDDDLAKSTGALLKAFGHNPRVFNSAEAVIEALGDVTPDVILSDIGMPRMDGLALAGHVRHQPHWNKIVLVAVTAFGEEEHRREAIAAGFDYRFVKPLAAADLRDFLNQLG